MASHDPSKYHFSTSTYVAMFTTLLTAYYMYVFVSAIPIILTSLFPAGILPCHRRADSRCRLRVSSTIARLSLNFQGVPVENPTFVQTAHG
jgi:delta24(24(1))-sterol reductase